MKFNFAKVTNSRLMGTMGLLINWEDKQDKIVQYFLLDAEGLGLADYVSLKILQKMKHIEKKKDLWVD